MTTTLFDTIADAATIQQRFETFDRENPHVYALFKRYAREAKAAGHAKFSSDALLHRIRWNVSVETRRAEGEPKINDHFSSRFARKLMHECPEFHGFFELRKLHAA